ncbi:unnamed protein product, partial [Protopolystoma xenopodis]
METVVRRGEIEMTGYPCPHCEYFAKWPTELQKHIMVHSKERPHQCIVCGLTYKWKWDLGRHFDKSHHEAANPYKKNPSLGAGNMTTGASVTFDEDVDKPGRLANLALDKVSGSNESTLSSCGSKWSPSEVSPARIACTRNSDILASEDAKLCLAAPSDNTITNCNLLRLSPFPPGWPQFRPPKQSRINGTRLRPQTGHRPRV